MEGGPKHILADKVCLREDQTDLMDRELAKYILIMVLN